jgi:hypothetical protein
MRGQGAGGSGPARAVEVKEEMKEERPTVKAAWPAQNLNSKRGQRRETGKSKPMAISQDKRLALLNRHGAAEAAKSRAAQITVPGNLSTLLGPSITLNTSSYKANRAVAQAGGDLGPVFSSTGQLPTNLAALQSIRALNNTGREESSMSAAKTALVELEEASGDPVDTEKTRQAEYEKYLRSPFSFIDKVPTSLCYSLS